MPKKRAEVTDATASGDRIVTVNRRARRNYEILDTVDAGIVLTGTEIKSIRDGKVNIAGAFARFDDGELWLHNAHISPYPAAGQAAQHEPLRTRKLLLHRREIQRFGRAVEAQRLTMVPLRLYIRKHLAKVEVALARGRTHSDRREVIKRRDADRDMARERRRGRTLYGDS